MYNGPAKVRTTTIINNYRLYINTSTATANKKKTPIGNQRSEGQSYNTVNGLGVLFYHLSGYPLVKN